MTDAGTVEGLLRELAPQALVVLGRRHRSFADCEDAVQGALIEAATTWPTDGVPQRPLGWLITVASRDLVDRYRADDARRRREHLAAGWARTTPEPLPDDDDTLTVLFMCCHEALPPHAAIPLTLRAVSGLTTRQIARAFLVSETTMAQRISRAKATIRQADVPFAMPDPGAYPQRLREVLQVIYLTFNEGYTASEGDDLDRPDLAAEAIRLARLVHHARPEDPEVAGLLALLLLTEARRAARTGPHGELVPLEEQDRRRWDRSAIREGLALLTGALRRHQLGSYQLQASIAGVHAQAASHEDTDWHQLLRLYDVLARRGDDPIVALGRVVAIAMVHGPVPALAALEPLTETLADHHRLHAVRADLLERAGRHEDALAAYGQAIQRATNTRERDHLQARAAELRAPR